jgi:ABC-2 type transport system ATP-binding protein
VLGFDVRTRADEVRERSGALLEHPGIYERLTAVENLEFYGRVWRMSASQRRTRMREVLDQFGLWDRRDEPVGRWSRGMKQKLAVARTVLHRPPLIFLDEPTAGLDPIGAAGFDQLIGELRDSLGLTVFLITHDLDTLYAICDRVAVLADRKVIAVGTIPQLLALDHPWIQEYFKGPRGRAAAAVSEREKAGA